jgi:predicted transcriptional regulator
MVIKMFEGVEKCVRILFGSGLRTKLLLTLHGGSKNLRELQLIMGIASSSINAGLKDLIRKELVEKTGWGRYRLTSCGRIITSGVVDIINSLYLLENHKGFWLTHRIDAIPEHLLKELICLPNLSVVGEELNPFEVHDHISEILRNAENMITAIFPVITADWVRILVEMADKGVKVSFIADEDVLNMIKYSLKKHPLLFHRNIEYNVNQGLRLGFVSNGETISLLLFNDHGLDVWRRLVSSGSSAAKWGEKLFEYYRERAGS